MAKVTGKVQAKKIINSDDRKKVSTPIPISDRATKRVIAPYVRIVRKGTKPIEIEEAKQFSIFLQRKPSVLTRDLSSFLSDSVDLPSLLHETADVLKNVTKAAAVTLYMMDSAANEIYVSRKIPTDERHKIRWNIENGTTVATYVANKKEYVLVDDILQDDRFPDGIGYEGISTIKSQVIGETIKSVLCVPVVTPDGQCFAVIELYRQLFDGSFSSDDLKITVIVTGWMGAAVHQNSQRLALKRKQELNDYLLDLTKCYFGETVIMEKMILEIVKFARVTLAAEKATFFVIDRDSEELVADMFEEGEEESKDPNQYRRGIKVRFGKERGIAGVVARTGVTVNVKDAYKDTRFNKEIDQKTGFITRSILCMPIIGVDGILGVVQVVNKRNGGCFTSTDEALTKTFCVYSALALHYTKKRLHNCFLKLVKLQQKPCIHDMDDLMVHSHVTVPPDFNQFSWYISPVDRPNMPHFCFYMFTQIIDDTVINKPQIMQFILSVRKLYRKVPYHNFEHAFSVCHCMYLILTRNLAKFTPIEIKTLLIATLCHDVDHPGFTNNFLQMTKDDLSFLYENSTLENHHYYVTIQILEECKMFVSLTDDDVKLLHEGIKEAILATDTFNHFKYQTKLLQICKQKSFDWNDPLHRSYLKAIMMTSCDLSGQCKPFLVAKRITDNLYVEYYREGDLEKEMGSCPLPLMDREMQYTVAEDQVRFLSIIVIPCVDLLRTILPNTERLYNDA
ncbi:cAMP and cAMP-inhibited cGMP 3',5'-cyclic phosphodiesterase 10A, partial [Asbolus verrucosus]